MLERMVEDDELGVILEAALGDGDLLGVHATHVVVNELQGAANVGTTGNGGALKSLVRQNPSEALERILAATLRPNRTNRGDHRGVQHQRQYRRLGVERCRGGRRGGVRGWGDRWWC